MSVSIWCIQSQSLFSSTICFLCALIDVGLFLCSWSSSFMRDS
jgi:hypothetical protein